LVLVEGTRQRNREMITGMDTEKAFCVPKALIRQNKTRSRGGTSLASAEHPGATLHVQTFVSPPPVETFDEPILHRTPRSNETEMDVIAHHPGFHGTTAELALVWAGLSLTAKDLPKRGPFPTDTLSQP
jgi:hypothetical protein